jgi:acyl-coenzyme A synthetase/AMP-(fatty) acid ligase
MTNEPALYDERDGIAIIAPNRPDQLNTLTEPWCRAWPRSTRRSRPTPAEKVVRDCSLQSFCTTHDAQFKVVHHVCYCFLLVNLQFSRVSAFGAEQIHKGSCPPLLILNEIRTQVRQQPENVAVGDLDKTYTFTQIDAVSDRLAALLYNHRHSDNDINGYLGPVSVDSVTANLAAYKAGQCIAALDPRHPVQVLIDLIEHSKIARVLVPPGQEELAQKLAGTSANLLPLPTEVPVRSSIPVFEPIDASPTSLATIVYTSGSTGRPKGSVNTRQFFQDRWRRNGSSDYRTDDVGASFWTFRWEDQLRMLSDGARNECFDFGMQGGKPLANWMNDRKVSNLVSYMFLYRQATMASGETGLPHVRRIFLLGEPIRRSDLELFNEKFAPDAEMISRFGSSEYGAMAVYSYFQGDPIRHEILPIGKAIHEGTMFVLNEAGEEVSQGELGEVAFSSPVVPHGYHKDPERSASVFMPDDHRPGNWRYHTGDLGYIDERGDVCLIGRKDAQIKIRGYTVRPPEVEQMISEHPAVALTAVVPFEGPNESTLLACHYVPKPGCNPTPREFRLFLAERAPSYMIPVAYIPHESMPLAPNGKVQKSQLPSPRT